MPIYEYVCEDCGAKFEKLVRNSAQSEGLECPSCGDRRLTQQLSSFAAHANGTQKDAAPSCGEGMCGLGQCGLNFN